MKYYKIIFIGLTIISIILSFILSEFFIIFPFFLILPLSCGIRRRAEEAIDITSNSLESEQVIEKSINGNEKRCNSCNSLISEQNLRFCPNCGKKLKN